MYGFERANLLDVANYHAIPVLPPARVGQTISGSTYSSRCVVTMSATPPVLVTTFKVVDTPQLVAAASYCFRVHIRSDTLC